MRDAIDPNGNCLPVRYITGRKIIQRDRNKSIGLHKALRNIIDVSLECTVGRSPGGLESTSLLLKTIASNNDILKYFSARFDEIKCKSVCGSIKKSIIKNCFISNHNAYLEFSFPLDRSEMFTCERQRAVEEIFAGPIEYIRSLPRLNSRSPSRVRSDFLKLNEKLQASK